MGAMLRAGSLDRVVIDNVRQFVQYCQGNESDRSVGRPFEAADPDRTAVENVLMEGGVTHCTIDEQAMGHVIRDFVHDLDQIREVP